MVVDDESGGGYERSKSMQVDSTEEISKEKSDCNHKVDGKVMCSLKRDVV